MSTCHVTARAVTSPNHTHSHASTYIIADVHNLVVENPPLIFDSQPTVFPLPLALSIQFQLFDVNIWYIAWSHFQHHNTAILLQFTYGCYCMFTCSFSNIHLIASQCHHFLLKCSAHHSLHLPTSIHPFIHLSIHPFLLIYL